MEPVKKKVWTTLRILIISAFTILGIGTAYYLKAERTQDSNVVTHKDIENRIYPDVQTLQKAIDHDNEVPTDVENFKREVRLIEQGDIQINQQVKLDSQQLDLNKNIKVFYEFQIQEKYDDSISEITKQISRDQRSDDMKLLLNNSINQTNAINAINQRLDTIRN